MPDIATNIAGAVAGWLLGSRARVPRTVPLPRVLYPPSIVLGLALTLTMLPRSVPSDLSNWDPAFQIKVGSETGELTGWRGVVSGISITAGAMSAGEIAKRAAHGPGKLPRTLPKSDPELFRKITAAGQFTTLLWMSTDDLKQKGPVRIVTWSRDISASNMTIGQDGARIVFRVRTPSTNAIGGRPETRTIPVLEPGRPSFVACTYDGVFARVFINGGKVTETNLSVKYALSGLPSLAAALISGFLLALGSRLFLSPSLTPARLSIGIVLAGCVVFAVSGWGLPPEPTLRFVALFTAGVLGAGASVQPSGPLTDISNRNTLQ